MNYVLTGPLLDYILPADGTTVHDAAEVKAGFRLIGSVPIDFASLGAAGHTRIDVFKEGAPVSGATSKVSDTEIKFTPSSALTNGNYQAGIIVYDTLGNYQTYEKRFIIDDRTPTTTLEKPETQRIITNTAQVHIKGSVTDTTHNITSVFIKIYDSQGREIQTIAVTVSADKHSAGINSMVTLPQDGAYTIVVSASNELAIASVYTIYVILDRQGPEADIEIG